MDYRGLQTVLVEIMFYDVHGREVHKPEAKARHDPNGDVEDGEGRRVKVFNRKSSHQQTKGC